MPRPLGVTTGRAPLASAVMEPRPKNTLFEAIVNELSGAARDVMALGGPFKGFPPGEELGAPNSKMREQMMQAAMLAPFGITAFHGSPYKFAPTTPEAKGFDVNKTYYHGTNKQFSGFSMNAEKATGGGLNKYGVFVSEHPGVANRYATLQGQAGANVRPVYVKSSKRLPLSAIEFERLQSLQHKLDAGGKLSELEDIGLEQLFKKHGISYEPYKTNPIQAIKQAGYDAIEKAAGRGGAEAELMVFDPKNVTSKFSGNPLGEFDMSKIGTGEGAQAYGHGLYFAENPKTANFYKGTGPNLVPSIRKGGVRIEDELLSSMKPGDNVFATTINDVISRGRTLSEQDLAHVKEVLQNRADLAAGTPRGAYFEDALNRFPELSKKVLGGKFGYEAGNLYKVDIPDSAVAKMLDWDKPLSQQPESVRKALNVAGIISDIPPVAGAIHPPAEGGRIYRHFVKATGSDTAAAGKLRELGIPGIKYLDQGSRATSGGELLDVFQQGGKWFAKVKVANRGGVGFQSPTDMITTSAAMPSKEAAQQWAQSKIGGGTSNFVLFDENLAKILERK